MILFSRSVGMLVLLLGVIVLLFVGSFGAMGMNMSDGGQMANCPFMGQSAICHMNPLQHIAAWQNMFAASLHKDTLAFLVLLLLALAVAFSIRSRWPTKKEFLSVVDAHLLRARLRVDAPLVLSSLQEAISNGIIHPKVY